MNRDDITRMAQGRDNLLLQMIKRHFPHIPIDDDDTWRMFLDFANEIYATGAAAEREACAALCFQMWNDSLDRKKFNHPDAEDCAAAIRARGRSEALTNLNKAAEDMGQEL